MNTVVIILRIFQLILFIIWFYSIYQIARNNKVASIRTKWIYNNDSKWYKYSYDEMFDPSKNNLYGLLWPNEKHYK